jgi:L-fucono-1,5-lactonase
MSWNIVDAHQHLWNLDRVAYPWLTPDFGVLCRTYEPSELEPQLAPAGVTHTVLVQAANSYADTEYMFEQATTYPWIIGVIGWVPLLMPDVAGRAIERFQRNPIFRGVRHLIHNEPDPKWLLQERVFESLRLLAGSGLTFDVVATLPEHMECIPVLSDKVPDLKMVIDHLGQPPIQTRMLGRWGDDLRIAAQNPNVYGKISGLGTASGNWESWTADDLRPYVEYALEVFGPERCMCGGDWPVSVLAGGYVRAWRAYRAVLSSLPAADQERVLSETAMDFYGLVNSDQGSGTGQDLRAPGS